MKKSKNNFLKVTIYQAKICSGTSISSYNLKLKFCKQIIDTEKIASKDSDFGIRGKSYFFDFPQGGKLDNLEISAISKTLLIFDSFIAKVSISVNTKNLNDIPEWYFLKNSKDENVMSILISIYSEIKLEKEILRENNTNVNNSFVISKPQFQHIFNIQKNDLSYDIYRDSSNLNFLNLLNKISNDDLNENGDDNILQNMKNSDDDGKIINNLNYKLVDKQHVDHTMVVNDNIKSPDISQINFNNILSPKTNRLENSRFNLSMLNITNLNTKLSNNNLMSITKNNYNNNINFFFNENLYTNNDSLIFDKWIGDNNEEQSEIVHKIKYKIVCLKEGKEKLRKLKDELNKNRDQLKQKEMILLKEKEKLESQIKIFKSSKSELKNKTVSFNEAYLNFNKELNKFKNDKEMFNNEKFTFLNINLINCFEKYLSNFPGEKPKKIKSKSSINNVNFPNSTRITASSGSFKNNSKNLNSDSIIKKEIIFENPQNFRLYTSGVQDINSKIRLSYRPSQDVITKTHCGKDQNSNSNHSSESYSITSNNEISSLAGKSFNNFGNINYQRDSKFYTPIAQINLNTNIRNLNNSNSPPNSNISKFKIFSPTVEKNIQETKLIDSLDTSNLLYTTNLKNIVNISSKQSINDNDEHKIINKKIENKKKINMKIEYGSGNSSLSTTTNNTNINSSCNTNINTSNITTAITNTKEKDKKLSIEHSQNSKSRIGKTLFNTNSTNTYNTSSKVVNLNQNYNKNNQILFSNSKLTSARKKKI